MTHPTKFARLLIPAVLLLCRVPAAQASDFRGSGATPFGFTPRVPISALARPAAWFDRSRLHMVTSVSMGSGFGGGTAALQTTSFSYQFKAPVWMSASLGNAWGPSARGNSSMFLQGLDLGVQPFSSLQLQVHYRNFRSPLQYDSFVRPYGWGE